MRGRLLRKVGWKAQGAAAALWAALAIFSFWDVHGDDLASSAVAAHLIQTGQAEHLYDHHPELFNLAKSRVLRVAGIQIGYTGQVHPFVHPPLLAYTLAAFPAAPFPVFYRIFLVLSVLAMLASLRLTLALAAPQLQDCAFALFLPVLLIPFEPLRYALWLGQTSPLILLLCLGALERARREAAASAGLLLAAAAFLKVSPAVLVLVWLWRGPRRAVAWFVGGMTVLMLLSLLVAGPERNQEYLSGVLHVAATTLAAYNNASLLAFLQRFTLPYEGAFSWRMLEPEPDMRFVASTALLAFVVAMFVLLRRIPEAAARHRRGLTEAAAMLVMLLAPSLVWTHYLLFVVPVVAILIAVAVEQGQRRLAWVAAAACVGCCRPFTPNQCFPTFLGHNALALGFSTIALIVLAAVVVMLGVGAGASAPSWLRTSASGEGSEQAPPHAPLHPG